MFMIYHHKRSGPPRLLPCPIPRQPHRLGLWPPLLEVQAPLFVAMGVELPPEHQQERRHRRQHRPGADGSGHGRPDRARSSSRVSTGPDAGDGQRLSAYLCPMPATRAAVAVSLQDSLPQPARVRLKRGADSSTCKSSLLFPGPIGYENKGG